MREEGKSRRKEDNRGTSLAQPPAFFLHTFLRAVPTILEQTGFINISGDQITSNRRSKRARSGYVLCIAFILNGNQKEFWLYRCYACVIVTRRLVLRDL